MQMYNKSFVEQELDKIADKAPYIAKIQIRRDGSPETRWMNITDEMLAKIKRLMMKGVRARWYYVRLNGRCIDQIHFTGGGKNRAERCEAVKRSLVDHDGYDPTIIIKEAKRP